MDRIVEPYFKKFKNIEGYFIGERKTFGYFHSNPKNTDLREVLLKTTAVGDPDCTMREANHDMASNIVSLNIDHRLSTLDTQLVNEIAELGTADRNKYFYTFATRYCNYHSPKAYPIYDKLSSEILLLFFQKVKDQDLADNTLLDYGQYKQAMEEFSKSFQVKGLDYWELDKFLWLYGNDVIVDLNKETRLN